MKLNFIFLVFAILFGIKKTFTQTNFVKVYDYNKFYDGALSAIQTIEGGYFSIGVSFIFSPSLVYGVSFVKTNNMGDTIWNKFYDFNPTAGDFTYSVFQLKDSSFSICGWYGDTLNDPRCTYVLNLSKDGVINWFKPIDAGFNDRCTKHIKTKDNDLILGGFFNDTDFTYSILFLIKTDSLANTLWQKNYTELTTGFYWLRNLEQTHDKGYILSGDFYDTATDNQDLFLLKTDSVGNFKWIKYYGDSLVEQLGFAISLPDGGFMMVSGKTLVQDTTVCAGIFRTDSVGNILWQKQYYYDGFYSFFQRIRLLPDGSFIVGGGTSNQDFPQHRPRIWLLKFNAQGDTLWSKKFTYYGKSAQYADVTDDYLEDLNLTNDGGFIISGYVINNMIPTYNDLLLIKTDCNGNTCAIDTTTWEGCSYSDCGFMQAAIAVSADTLDLKYSDTLYFSSASNYSQQWLWNFADMASSALQNPYFVFADSGTFNISLITYFNGCSDTAHKTVVVINSDCSYINAAFAASADTIDLQHTNTILFTDASTQANQWLWNFGDSTTSSLQNPQHEFDTTGTFTVTLMAFYGNCSDTAFKTVVVKNSIGIENISFSQNGIKIIPNPAKEKVRIIANETNAELTIFNSQGVLVFEKSIMKETEIDVVEWKSGVYVMKVKTEKSIFVGKMVKE